ncbi:MAG: hypothetical protein JSS83_27130 [Cyanobacteria bacterium SZAS LIN-3]|nr:hypothetical protein [Cyanobacteria bacterium SZAS LIN-3]
MRTILVGAACSLVAATFAYHPAAGQARTADVLLAPPLAMPAKPARVLHFPADYSLGAILVAPNPYDEQYRRSEVLQIGARGDVAVAANKIVIFVPGQRFYKNPTLINTIPPDAVDGLRVSASTMDDAEDTLCNRALSLVGHLKDLVWLNLDRSDADDAALAHAGELPELRKLSAFSTTIRGDCFKEISTLKKLNTLHLSYNNIRESNYGYLKNMPALCYLHLGRTNMSDAGLVHIGKCLKLEALDISQNNVTDAAIKDILALKKLRFLLCRGTKITPAGIIRLKALPALREIVLPAARYRQSDMALMQAALPGVKLVCWGASAADKDTKELYAPLH